MLTEIAGLGATDASAGQKHLAKVQAVLGLPASDSWGEFRDQSALAAWQQSHGLPSTGLTDPRTFWAMDVYDPMGYLPDEWVAHIAGDAKAPGHFGRDFNGATDQVPRWAWATAGVGLLGIAGYLLWRGASR